MMNAGLKSVRELIGGVHVDTHEILTEEFGGEPDNYRTNRYQEIETTGADPYSYRPLDR